MIDYEQNTQELKELSFSSVLEHLGITAKKKGSHLVTTCLWHNDSHPSLYLNEEKHYCHCFSCGKTATTIDYVMQKLNLDFKAACEWLRREFGKDDERWMMNDEEKTKDGSTTISTTFDKNKRVVGSCQNCRYPNNQKRKNKKRVDDYLKDFAIRERNTTLYVYPKNDNWTSFSPEYVEQHVSMENSFSKCLLHYFDREIVEAVTHNYCLGCYHFKSEYLEYWDDVMFPSIDKDLVVHDIKLQHYETDPKTARFFHCDRSHILWMGKMLQKRGEIKKEANFDQSPLFGEHLLGLQPDKTVVLVESPKNALIGACAFPQYLWVAAGCKDSLSRSNLEVLRDRKVIVLPDNDAVEDWKSKLEGMSSIANFTFSSLIDLIGEECGEKGDIGDLILMKVKKMDNQRVTL